MSLCLEGSNIITNVTIIKFNVSSTPKATKNIKNILYNLFHKKLPRKLESL